MISIMYPRAAKVCKPSSVPTRRMSSQPTLPPRIKSNHFHIYNQHKDYYVEPIERHVIPMSKIMRVYQHGPTILFETHPGGADYTQVYDYGSEMLSSEYYGRFLDKCIEFQKAQINSQPRL